MELEALDITTSKINQFEKKGINSVEDLARFFPRKYYDFRKITPINAVKNGEICAVVGTITEVIIHEKFFKVKIRDDFNSIMAIIWFIPKKSQGYHKMILKPGLKFIFCGKVQIDEKYRTKQIASPICFSQDIQKYQRIIPIYSKIKGMSDEFLQQSIDSALALINKNDYLEPIMLNKFELPKMSVALRNIHQPSSEADLELAKKRFVFDDLFIFAMQLAQLHQISTNNSKYVMPKMAEVKKIFKNLPFALTDGQTGALRKMCEIIRSGKRLNSLVQGDVGCGKTIVAFLMMFIAWENGLQSALMCPTNILAKQHYEELLKQTKDFPCKVAFLNGDLKTKEKREILKGLEDGTIDIVVGTHSVISKDVKFHNLALTVVDEEHRFGVVQRNLLKEKAKQGVHNITMSATPIPRTLAMTLYGEDIDVLTINTLPKGRQPVKTVRINNEEKTYEAMYRQIKEGRQCYVICPLVEDIESDTSESSEVLKSGDDLSETVQTEDVKKMPDSVVTIFKKMTDYFKKYPEVKLGMVSGDKKVTKPEEVKETIEKFTRNELQILISTTVIEVGVNVPNASVIVIRNAERFGLAQLHQLRGRVGRGSHQSYCVLLSDKKDNPKIKVMCETNNGFKIAEEDLKLRGAGDFIGTKQSGSNKYIMLMLANLDLYSSIKEEVNNIYKDNVRINRYDFLNEIDISDK